MKPNRITGYMLGEQYLISGGKTYRIEQLKDDESLAETYNDGDVLPLINLYDNKGIVASARKTNDSTIQ